jgi:type II secretory pathway component PulF
VWFLKTPDGARKMDEIFFQIPGLNRVFVLVERIRFNTAISMMLASGILIDRCLEMAVGNVKNHVIRQTLVVAKERVKKGEPLARVLSMSPLYPDFSISLIEVGEESGQLEPVFNELSARARREFEGWVKRFTTLLEPMLILFMGVIVGGVVVTMLLSIVSVNDIGI